MGHALHLNFLYGEGMKTDGNGQKNLFLVSISIFFCKNMIGFGNAENRNGIGICGHTETNKCGWKFNGTGRKPGTIVGTQHAYSAFSGLLL
jgi:hypothetical protein